VFRLAERMSHKRDASDYRPTEQVWYLTAFDQDHPVWSNTCARLAAWASPRRARSSAMAVWGGGLALATSLLNFDIKLC
jgi:hypothetical protein